MRRAARRGEEEKGERQGGEKGESEEKEEKSSEEGGERKQASERRAGERKLEARIKRKAEFVDWRRPPAELRFSSTSPRAPRRAAAARLS